LNPGRHSGNPATTRLRYGTAYLFVVGSGVCAKHQTCFPIFDFSFDYSDFEIVEIGQNNNRFIVLPFDSSTQLLFVH
jgi:hypothetical protein